MRLSLLAACIALFSAIRSQAGVTVWIDTDPSVARGGHEVDDGLALLQAFRSPIVAVAGRRLHQKFSAQPSAKPFRDFNFEMDAPAFQVLLDSKVPLVLTPWEISSKVWLGEKELGVLRKNDPSASWVWDAAEDWLKFWRQNLGTTGFNPFDTLAVGYVAAPDRFRCEPLPLEIQRLPDDIDQKNPEKPYLIADRNLRSPSSALYCFETPPGFAVEVVRRIGQVSALDHSVWNELTGNYINAEARVDYRALKERDLPRLDAYLRQLASKWPEGLTQPERKAALINAYNALTVRWVLANYPVESIWRTKHPFTEPRHTLNGEKISLDGIEGQLRAMGDPRIHAALVCAARSCPPLRREAYSAQSLDEQLDDNFRRWLANKRLNEFLPQRRTADVSMIFKWYADDFRKTGDSVEKYLIRFGPQEQVRFLAAPGSHLDYKTYNWGLNDASTLGSDYSQAKFYWDALRNK